MLKEVHMNLKSIEVLSQDETTTVIAHDSSDKEYRKTNTLSYYVLCNTWLMIIQSVSRYGYLRIKDSLLENGLLNLIASASDSADRLVHGFPILNPMWEELSRECRIHYHELQAHERLNSDLNIGRDYQATLLFILRYPKRFTPNSNDWIQEKSLQEFIQFENRTKMIQRKCFSPHIIGCLQVAAQSVLNWDKLCDEIQAIKPGDFIFSTGVGYDTTASVGSKFLAMYNHGCYGNIPLFLQTEEQMKRIVRVQAVPKSYKASRIIAMEDTYRQAYAKRISKILRRYTPTDIDVTDQTRNQRLAQEGSRYGNFATLDLSHGSDAISESLFRAIFPERFVNLVIPYFGTHTEINGKIRLMQTLSTAGHSLTFDIETLVFYIIGIAACELDNRFGNANSYRVSVYGDDIIVDSSHVNAVVAMLEYLGFIVNDSKSFYTGKYRESCGEEYFEGVSNTSLYFPRFPIVGSITNRHISFSDKTYNDEYRGKKWDCTTMLIDLQHKLFPVCYHASRFIYELVKAVYPKLTFSQPGTPSNDLWEFGDTSIERKFPMGRFSESGELEYLPSKTPEFSSYTTRDLTKKVAEPVETVLTGVDFVHSVPEIHYTGGRCSNSEYDLYRYYEFLRTGPTYRDPLMELLKVSEPLKTKDDAFGRPVFRWRLRG
jgi:hypothetical protein